MQTSTKFEDLETELINKIRKTPYWLEYSTDRQKNMIEKYFENRIQSEMYSNISYTSSDKQEFVENVLTLSNYR